jgi:HSP20 family protein
MADLVPMNFLRFPMNTSLWEDMTDIDNWFSPLATNGNMNGLSISEDDKNVYIEAATPGVDPKDIDVTFHKGVLWIKGEAKEEEKKKKYYRKATSSFSYRVAIPEDVDANTEPTAECVNGMMTVTFAKSPKTQPKKIAIKSNGNGKKMAVKK